MIDVATVVGAWSYCNESGGGARRLLDDCCDCVVSVIGAGRSRGPVVDDHARTDLKGSGGAMGGKVTLIRKVVVARLAAPEGWYLMVDEAQHRPPAGVD